MPRGIYNVHRWLYPLRLAAAGQVECTKAPQCHKTPRCGQLDQVSGKMNCACVVCIVELGCTLVSELMGSKCSHIIQVFSGKRAYLQLKQR